MRNVGILKLKSAYDVEWKLPKILNNSLVLNLISKFGEKAGISYLKNIKELSGNSFMPQITPFYLAALGEDYNSKKGTDFSFNVFDDYLKNLDVEKLNNEFDLVLITSTTTTINDAYTLADKLNVPTIIGGIHASMLPEEVRQHAIPARGEAETIMPKILDDFVNGKLREEYRGTRIEKLDNLSIPKWELADSNYTPLILPLQTSRGCGNACSYCSTTRFQGSKRRHRPIEDIIAEMNHYIDKGWLTKDVSLFLTDNNSVADTNHHKGVFDTSYAKKLFSEVYKLQQKTGVDFTWVGQGEINMADDLELMDIISKSGCNIMLIGYESLSQDNLNISNKVGNKVENFEYQTKVIHDYGINIIGCFVFGMKNDNPDVFEKTYQFIKKNNIEIPQLSLQTPYPGTNLYRYASKKGLILNKDWSKYDITHSVMQPECLNKDGKVMSLKELDQEYVNLFKKVYSTKQILLRSYKNATRNEPNAYKTKSKTHRFLSVMMPNIVYKNLGLIGR